MSNEFVTFYFTLFNTTSPWLSDGVVLIRQLLPHVFKMPNNRNKNVADATFPNKMYVAGPKLRKYISLNVPEFLEIFPESFENFRETSRNSRKCRAVREIYLLKIGSVIYGNDIITVCISRREFLFRFRSNFKSFLLTPTTF